jgi:hypothetical protein
VWILMSVIFFNNIYMYYIKLVSKSI